METQFNPKISNLSEISEHQRSINFGRVKSVSKYVKIMFMNDHHTWLTFCNDDSFSPFCNYSICAIISYHLFTSFPFRIPSYRSILTPAASTLQPDHTSQLKLNWQRKWFLLITKSMSVSSSKIEQSSSPSLRYTSSFIHL